MTKIDKSFY